MDWTRRNAIGHGSSATVYIATSTSSDDVLAVKSTVLSQSNLLQKEQKILSSLSHPCVIGYKGFNVSREGGILMYNLFMEYMSQGTLGDEISRHGGRISDTAIGLYIREILKGLEYLHTKGLVHCDIKPKNILIGEDGVKIADFGCSKWTNSTGSIGGTPMFMSPEAARGEEQGFPCDIWALGCTIIEMITGASPWPNAANIDPISVLYRIGYSDDTPKIPSFLSHQIKDFLEKCLKRNPRERWTANQLLSHPFLGEFNSWPEKIKESYSNSPTSILDQDLWNSMEEPKTLSNIPVHERLDDDRIRRLSEFSMEFVRWELGDENWINIR